MAVDRFAYRLELAAELETFRPEIEHALGFLEDSYPLAREEGAARVLRYGGPSSNLPAWYFPGAIQTASDGIRLDRQGFAKLAEFWPTAFDAATATKLDYDAIGVIFHLLSRVEERDAPEPDRHGRYRQADDLAGRWGRAGLAPADIAARDLAALIAGRRLEPLGRHEVVPTHDVDILRGYHRWWLPLREAAGDVIKRHRPGQALRRLSVYFAGEPDRSFDRLMGLSERHGLVSRFFFMGPSLERMDSPYAAIMPGLTRRMLAMVQSRGHVVGYHPGYTTLNDLEEWRRQRSGLEALAGTTVVTGRQHVLRYDAARTPSLWDGEGMVEDYTLGYTDAPAFRNGTARMHFGYDLVARRTLALRQGATPIMDFTLFDARYRALTPDAALEEVRPLMAHARAVNGRLVVLMHSGMSDGPVWRFYEQLLAEAA